MSEPYDTGLRALARSIALEERIVLREGVYVAVPGPNLETRAEYRMLRGLGADVVGMSTVPEVIAAVHMGARVACLSCVTNAAAGLGGGLSHAEVEATAQAAADRGVHILQAFLGMLAGSPGPG
jgi:purine-nucleoside phosphorylase